MSENPIERALVIVAHPDDVDFGAAGSIATWAAQGTVVTYCIVTDGEAGGSDESVPRDKMRRIRRREQTAAAHAVGVEDVRFLGHSDGGVVASLDLRRDITRVIRDVRPDRILCPSTERDYSRLPVSHPDHLAVGEAAICAIYPDARNTFAFPELADEGLKPHTVLDVWLMGSPRPDRVVDITGAIDKKVAALMCHESQLSDPVAIAERIRSWTGEVAFRGGLGEGHFAEEFMVVTIPF